MLGSKNKKTANVNARIGSIIGADRNIQKLPLGNRGWTQGPCIEYTFLFRRYP